MDVWGIYHSVIKNIKVSCWTSSSYLCKHTVDSFVYVMAQILWIIIIIIILFIINSDIYIHLDNPKMELKEIWFQGVDCIHLAQDRDQLQVLVNVVMNLSCSVKMGNSLPSRVTAIFSRKILLQELLKFAYFFADFIL